MEPEPPTSSNNPGTAPGLEPVSEGPGRRKPRSRPGERPVLQSLPAYFQDSAFTIADGHKLGLSRTQLRHPTLISVGHGIRAFRSADLDLAAKVRPFTRLNGASAASHDTAARLWNFPDPERRPYDRRVHVSRPSGGGRMQRPGVVSHRSRILPGEVTIVDGISLTARIRTWLDLAEALDLDDLVVIADYLLRNPRPEFEGRAEAYATREKLGEMLRRHPGKRGLRKAREALALARLGADSPPETRLRLAMARASLPEPEVNRPIRNHDGGVLHSPDLSLPEYRIAIEYEGESHGNADQIARDIEREERARAADWDEVRISKRHMANGGRRAVEKIIAALQQRGWNRQDAA